MALANQARAARQGGAAVRAIELHTRAAQDLLRDTGSRFAEDRAEIRALLEGASQ